jgi:hypothetical protein
VQEGPVKRRRTRSATVVDGDAASSGSSSSSSSRPGGDPASIEPSSGNGSPTSTSSRRPRVSRRTTGTAAGAEVGGSRSLPELQVLTPEALAAVKAKNPRQVPEARPGDDLAYD